MTTAETIWVFVDESGDTGYRFERGSSLLFCMTAVLFSDKSELEKLETRLASLKTKLGYPISHEFHYQKEPNAVREAFFYSVGEISFDVFAMIVDKTQLEYQSSYTCSPIELYVTTAVDLVQIFAVDDGVNYRIRIDGKPNKLLRTHIRKNLAASVHPKLEINFQKSKNNAALQLADMVVGVLARELKQQENPNKCLSAILRPKIKCNAYSPKKSA